MHCFVAFSFTSVWLRLSVFGENRDFKQRQRRRRRERHKVRENPKGPLRMTGGKRVNDLRSVPT